MTSVDLSVLKELVSRDLALTDEEIVGLETVDEQKLRNNLILIINYLLDNDFNRLINACYRLDINQDKFQQILNNSIPEEIAENFADLIISREKEKVKWRKLYSQK